jgi:hypothetical protein
MKRLKRFRNLFSILSHLTSQDENFLSESLVFLVYFMLRDQKSKVLEFLNSLCWEGRDGFDGKRPMIRTQENTKQGRPDILIAVPKKVLVLVEVKYRSAFGKGQVQGYWDFLKEKSDRATERNEKLETRLVLLTLDKKVVERGISDEIMRGARLVIWPDVADWLKGKAGSADCKFLVNEFLDFLKRRGLTNEKIGPDPDLLKMMRQALDAAGVQGISSTPWHSVYEGGEEGWKVDKGKCLANYYYASPELVHFSPYPMWQKLNKTQKDTLQGKFDHLPCDFARVDGPSVTIDLENAGYYDDGLSDDENLSLLTQFFEEYHPACEECLGIIQRFANQSGQ